MPKIRTAFNLLFEPLKWPFLYRVLSEKLGTPKIDWECSSAFSLGTCEQVGITPQDAFLKIYPTFQYRRIEEEFPIDLRRAHEEVQKARDSGMSMGGGGEFELIFNLVLASKAQKIVETGVAYGWSSFGILAALHSKQSGHLWSTNLPYPGMNCEEWVGCVVPPEWKSFWTLLSGKDDEVLPALLEKAGPLDCVFYDSAKSYAARRRSYPSLWNSLRAGGLFFSDDICDNMGFFHFSKCVGEKPIVVRHEQSTGKKKYAGILIKNKEHPPKEILF
jgi:hypothetical protein